MSPIYDIFINSWVVVHSSTAAAVVSTASETFENRVIKRCVVGILSFSRWTRDVCGVWCI